jgi:sensor histidine kinase YesM
LHEKETLAARAEALAAAARLDAIRARLNPHFLFNALHPRNSQWKSSGTPPMQAPSTISTPSM